MIRRWVKGGLPLLCAAALLASCSRAPAEEAPRVETIEAAMAKSGAGWNAGDMDRFMAIYSDDPETSFVAGDRLLRGKQSMIDRYRTRFDFDDPAKRGALGFETLDFRVLDPTHVLYILRYTLTYPDTEPASGIATLVFAKEADGWRIIADHSS